ncbi:uncharacterized protein A4U43_C04F300 [Asparagus officinalis]|uniref:Peptidase M28 domain-containing protein n=1 Tax=Asparagus officinalis TaxID=4686 RepID=A0A5P1F1U7_ASPOF|nr:uncharacterized protein A4U43_C04F300 [Asparagus officinalis]
MTAHERSQRWRRTSGYFKFPEFDFLLTFALSRVLDSFPDSMKRLSECTSKMPRRSNTSPPAVLASAAVYNESSIEQKGDRPQRSAFLWVALFILLLNGSWAVYYYEIQNLPLPVNTEQAGKRGFSEISAMNHVKYLAELGPHPVGSNALDVALEYVLAAAENIKQTAHWEVDVQVDLFHADTGANRLVSGLFKGKTLIYSDLKHVVLRILPKYLPEAAEHVILVSSHIDTVFSAYV